MNIYILYLLIFSVGCTFPPLFDHSSLPVCWQQLRLCGYFHPTTATTFFQNHQRIFERIGSSIVDETAPAPPEVLQLPDTGTR